LYLPHPINLLPRFFCVREVLTGDSIPQRHLVHAGEEFADEPPTESPEALTSSSVNSLAISSIVDDL
jgi:hypothetical protein